MKIIIVGAGPAGMATALFLAKKNIQSVLIDKESYPRDKICGDGLSGWVLDMLRKINPEIVTNIYNHPGSLDSWGFRMIAPNLKSLDIPYRSKRYPNDPPGSIIKRVDFDQLLMNEVSAVGPEMITVLLGVNIKKINRSGAGVELLGADGQVIVQGDFLVLATGANSKLVTNLAGIRKEEKHYATGIKTYYTGLKPYTRLKASGVRRKDEEEGVSIGDGEVRNPAEFYFLKSVLPGYFWIFPLPNGQANVGLGIRTDVLKKKKLNLKTILYQAIEETPELKERFADAEQVSPIEAWGLPLGSKKQTLSGDRFILVGDAAWLIDPFTGEGVGNALNSGFHAANHIEKAMEAKRYDAAFNKSYDKTVYAKLWNELKMGSMMQKLMMKSRLFSFVMNKAVKSQSLQKQIISMIDSEKARKRLFRPWFYIGIIFGK